MNHQFNEILNNNCQDFQKAFKQAKGLFTRGGGNNRLIHSYEYGYYKEEVVRQFIRPLIEGSKDISEGFIITENNGTSKQCDVIVYDKNSCPLITNAALQRFFPIEVVSVVGEVKSILEFDSGDSNLKDALIKLSEIKRLRGYIPDDITVLKRNVNEDVVKFCKYQMSMQLKNLYGKLENNISAEELRVLDNLELEEISNIDTYINDTIIEENHEINAEVNQLKELGVSYNKYKYNPAKWHFDMVTTFLICDKIKLTAGQSFEQLPSLIRSWYEQAGIPMQHWHSMILSLNDGIFLYNSGEYQTNCYPIYHGDAQRIIFIPKDKRKPYDHIKAFFHYLLQASSSTSILYAELGKYIKKVEFELMYTEAE